MPMTMTTAIIIQATVALACLSHDASAFSASPYYSSTPRSLQLHRSHRNDGDDPRDRVDHPTTSDLFDFDDGDGALLLGGGHQARSTRRSVLRQSLIAATAAAAFPRRADAALGSLPEFRDTNAVFQSLTVDVTDQDQYARTIAFFTLGFDGMTVLRERNGGPVKETWLGFGPETLNVPPDFELPVSALSQYGGHAAVHLRYDSQAVAPLYVPVKGLEDVNTAPAPGDNVAYLQLGVTQYRISQMQKNGGNVLDAYGWVNVVSPTGLPVRAIVGVRADPMMFVALNCNDVSKSEEFYAKLGFARQEYPYARLNQGQGQFEPPQPPNSVYLAPSVNSMGILLLQNEKRRRAVAPNPVLRSLNVVYAPPENGSGGGDGDGADATPQLTDPSSVPIAFVAQEAFEREIQKTALPRPRS